jgi:pyridoxal phosphate enzyme (YggS family)
MECYDAGHRDFGENYVQEIVEKAAVMPLDVRWRFIGHVQSNKAKALVKGVPGLVTVETVDSVKLANKLDAAVKDCAEERMKAFKSDANPKLGVMVQVNTSGEESKFGVEPGDALALAKHIQTSCGSLKLEGLMTIGMPDYTSRPENFDALKKCRDEVCAGLGVSDPTNLELSMGMSGDFEAAIEMGSDNVRVGSSIFGAREYMYSVKPEK